MSEPSTPPTLAMVVLAWLEETHMRVDLAASTLGTYTRVSKHLRTWGRELPVGVVRMAGYVMERRQDGISPRTIALELRVASAAFNWAQRERIVGTDARLRLPRLKIDPNRFVLNHRTPSPGEAARVIEAMPNDDWRLAMLILARTAPGWVRWCHCGGVISTRRAAGSRSARWMAPARPASGGSPSMSSPRGRCEAGQTGPPGHCWPSARSRPPSRRWSVA